MTELTVLIIFIAIGYYWYNQVNALDASRLAGKKVTNHKGWAFLDDSISQKAIRIKPRFGKLALLRIFEFEFSDINAQRFNGIITHHGGVVTEIKYFHANEIETVALTQQ
ncbi:DUF3301 domain-containing protein [Marinicella sp. S1101]|uniref:DUF3301 domain-containing protein n=1 Tax=Marinicella marina TaxID=2996016 RepID=UPI0022609049|nr:DUF3301 domain-containing protein [Marinicella marina]MCX7553701.1 DUF3301 domain-containing protein [Marinicella marina]MDJ1140791.1 DUF3301 domain-containing protein [Marinicella marina]